jgi:GNAT superfamily N-acetyltransferase
MFPGQGLIPTANQAAFAADTGTRVSHILTLTMSLLANGELDRRGVVFPLFMAGVATNNPNAKAKAIDLLKSYEGHGIGQNTSVVRRLLVAVCEEQNRRLSAGRRMEEVDWLRFGKERGMSVVNCGL